ncbi:putative AIM2 family protein [Smittium mucronatum]|uniref:Putative AIM2 family protein n=1 Tax=Smittium mucronatum TaxID=133383 RepID=A0A1R0GT18_9FUNG|nr:putative AIM2 family protein [Smittium mucronatum]
MVSFTKHTIPHVTGKHVPKGERFTLGDDLECYISGDKSSKVAIIYCYDIFLFKPNHFEIVDLLGSSGYRVIMPDFLRNKPIPEEELKDVPAVVRKLEVEILSPQYPIDFDAVKEYLVKVEKMEKILLIGEMLGARMAMIASQHDPIYLGMALMHPACVHNEQVESVKIPTILINSSDDVDLSKGAATFKAKPFANLCYFEVFPDMVHGFASGFADWTDPKIAKRVDQTYRIINDYFARIINGN